MKSDVLSLSDFAFLAQISTVLFVAVFLGAIYWMFRPGSKQAYAQRSRMPLDDVNPVEPLDR
ncbi:Cbb3-type cytochrome oxidase component FixQ [Enhygromyxa salina]|uniref:Cbb3-type cytochrome oxidase component FixQ n=1 Tax=Enhygromyxa salina TaxID=215803 RepID=A0A2S9XV38_9BACT|nr:cbb3-type cytochrome c oxidase subunit 3 [Enhygromyxa salina]PRP96600.1 Cbb3-type cytochrome oxidase component FixQ [Enhygromyxa salina]